MLRCDCPFPQISSTLFTDSVCGLEYVFPSSLSIGVEFLGFKHKKWFGVIAFVDLMSSLMKESDLELSLCSHSIEYV